MVEKLADILGGIEHGIGGTVKLCGMLSLWEEVVDERVRRNASAIKIRNRTLYVSTSSPAWAQELSYLKKEIIQKFNEKAGKEAIKDIRFKSGAI
jgi:predicted nucleic acid-binding Zn ribbon protein